MTHGAFDLSRTPIHLGDADTAFALNDFNFDGPSFEAYIQQHCQADPGRLLMIETTPTDWSSWECHTGGAEIVHVLEGAGTFMQETENGINYIPITPGTTIINPPGVWHTADVTEPVRAIYITPCPGTQHKPRD